ncbi:DUF3303 domain-containing protein [Microvirga sp. 17 mud 1-3]|uniref:DUF3303 domain-containing protein n=1 Tax=Microvirga sp. 17 mud 1-3 TaxID=2082949 RepID=UPI00352F4297
MRIAPAWSERLDYVDSWVAADFSRCLQVMRCDGVALLQRRVAQWCDLAEFEIVPIAPGGRSAVALSERL